MYITKATRLAKQRRQLLQQLQQMPTVKLDGSQYEATRNAEEDILQKLEGLVTQENMLYVELLGNVGHGVSHVMCLQSGFVSACALQAGQSLVGLPACEVTRAQFGCKPTWK